MNNVMTKAEKLLMMRLTLGMSLSDVGNKLGISRGYVQILEKGKRGNPKRLKELYDLYLETYKEMSEKQKDEIKKYGSVVNITPRHFDKLIFMIERFGYFDFEKEISKA